MASKMADFLIAVTEDPQRRKAFRDDPAGELAKSGLTGEQQQLLKSGDIKAIRQAIKKDTGDKTLVVMYETVLFET